MENVQDTHIFFVDDEPEIRTIVQRALASPGVRVRAFCTAEDCLAALSQEACEVVIADVRLEGMDGVSLLCTAKRRFPWIPIILTTGYGDVPMAVEAMKTGAADFLEKPLDRERLLAAVRTALATAVQPNTSLREGLSDTEAYVLRLILDGRTSREIANTLNRSVRTVESHRHRIMRKFAARNVAQLIDRVNDLGLGKNTPAVERLSNHS